jgi:antitoxin component YwqK of YwqJK toxin-antitoxin module
MQGLWKWYFESGQTLREENYVNGKREGEMKDYNEEGKVTLVGEFIDDKREGVWLYETNEYLEIGRYSNDEPDSLWKTYYMPGKKKRFEGGFLAGEPEGLHVAYYPEGQKMYVGKYVGGMKDGDWKFYDEQGTNFLTITYKNDIEIKWQGDKIRPTYEESLRTYNVKINENKTQTIRK